MRPSMAALAHDHARLVTCAIPRTVVARAATPFHRSVRCLHSPQASLMCLVPGVPRRRPVRQRAHRRSPRLNARKTGQRRRSRTRWPAHDQRGPHVHAPMVSSLHLRLRASCASHTARGQDRAPCSNGVAATPTAGRPCYSASPQCIPSRAVRVLASGQRNSGRRWAHWERLQPRETARAARELVGAALLLRC